MTVGEMIAEFICSECGDISDIKDKGKATRNDKPIAVCKQCCENEQKRQFYDSM